MATMLRVWFVLSVATLAISVAPSRVNAQTCDITDPTGSPKETWVALNTQAISFTHSGGFSYHDVIITDMNTGVQEFYMRYLSHTANVVNHTITVPSVVQGSTQPCLLEVKQYDVMGNIVAEDSVELNIFTN